MTEDEMVGWHHRLNGHEFELTPGVGDGQGRLKAYHVPGTIVIALYSIVFNPYNI